jgi:putative addiction module component (TIGR02574 family)
MSISQILEELPRLSPQERMRVAEQALALDVLSAEDEAVLEQRLGDHDRAPGTAIPLDDFLAQLRARYAL